MANRIHQTAVIGPQVEFGDDNIVGPFTVIQGPVRIGDGNYFAASVSIGGVAEVKGWDFTASWEDESADGGVEIGDNNVFKEFMTVHNGWHDVTRIGNNSMFMTKSHLGHDSVIGDDVALSCSVQLGGHVTVGHDATIGLGATVHQRGFVGAGSMVGMQAAVSRPIPPYTVCVGAPAKPRRLNSYRFEKMGIPADVQQRMSDVLLNGSDDLDGLPSAVLNDIHRWREAAAG